MAFPAPPRERPPFGPRGRPRPFIQHTPDAPSINEPLPPKDPTTPQPPAHPPVDTEGLFTPRQIGSIAIHFDQKGEPIKAKEAHGFLALKPRGQGTVMRHFVITSDSTLPSKKAVMKQLEAFYGRSKDYRIVQIHYQPA